MFKVINGWTKEKMKEQIRLRNNGKKSLMFKNGRICLYRSSEGNHCAAGCFIDDEFLTEGLIQQNGIASEMPLEILNKFPLEPDGMDKMQTIHDFANAEVNMRDVLCTWIDENVEE